MHKFPDIPVVEVGPGSQPQEQDGELAYMHMPTGMDTYHQPVMPEPEQGLNCHAGREALEAVCVALHRYLPGDEAQSFELNALDEDNIDFINQALGEGEVSVAFEKGTHSTIKAQESVLAGVWRVQHFNQQNDVILDTIEVGEVPHMVRHFAFAEADTTIDTHYDQNDSEIQNAPAILVELSEQLAEQQDGRQTHTEAHVINLSLLPLSQADLFLLGERLGVGPVTILSRGYGNCRIGSTGKRNGWWIKYFNSQDALILNTIEIVDIPSVAIAAPEDIADSAERLHEILDIYR